MFWLIIAGIVFLLGILFLVIGIKDDDGDFGGVGAKTILTAIAIIGFWFTSYVGWNTKLEDFKMLDAKIHNKIVKIEKMRQTYYNPPKNTMVNIDMVNKDLASSINNEIKDLEEFTNDYNDNLATWRSKYRFRFWNACYVKPPVKEPIDLLNYQF